MRAGLREILRSHKGKRGSVNSFHLFSETDKLLHQLPFLHYQPVTRDKGPRWNIVEITMRLKCPIIEFLQTELTEYA